MNTKQINVILGLQYGDEGKGKFTDILASEYDYILRYQGGDNAGHTIVIDNNKYSLRIIPSGIFNNKKIIIGNGCVLNIETLLTEINYLKQSNINVEKNLIISNKAHVILDYHIAIDKLQEDLKKENKIGTTCKGIGPCYSDKVNRIGIRTADLFDKEILSEKLKYNLDLVNAQLERYKIPKFLFDDVFEKYYKLGLKIKKYCIDTSYFINEEIKKDKRILLEGAQGVLLDIDHGTYPFVTSSCVATAMSSGSGIGITKINNVLGIVKAYSSRVGEGPFCTEIFDEIADKIREVGHEYGTVTKRPRRIGWLDIVALKYAINISGTTEIALTLLDVLSCVDKIKICTNYIYENKKIFYIPPTKKEYEKCSAEFIELDGWKQDISNITQYNDLPVKCKDYIQKIMELLEIPIEYISVGPNRKQTIRVNYDK